MYFTIFTPTYNRGDSIKKLYESLKVQTFRNFEWILIDDGSTDDTEKIVSELMKNANFPIIFKTKENGGKHTAINMGVSLAKGKFFFIVDSDDYLLMDSLERARKYCEQIDGDHKFAGVVGFRGDIYGNAWMEWGTDVSRHNKTNRLKQQIEEQDYIDATSFEYRYKYGISGDRAEIVKTYIMKEYPFPVFVGERFLSEGVLWSALANEGFKFRWFNEVIYITEEYRVDGLTKNIKKVHENSPKGVMFYNNQLLKYKKVPLKVRIKACINYYKYGKMSDYGISRLVKECNWKWLSYPFGFATFFIHKDN